MPLNLVLSVEVAALLNALLDVFERRELARLEAHDVRRQAIKLTLDDEFVPGYFSQTDPAPRDTANTQLQQLERVGLVRLDWLRGERGHLLAAVTLDVDQVEQAYELLGRRSLAAKRTALIELLLSERARYRLAGTSSVEQLGGPHDWRVRALSAVIHRLREGKSPAPFRLHNAEVNADLCTALHAVAEVVEETPQRVFSVRAFNDSKRFEHIAPKLATLAKRGNPGWRSFTREEVLRELNLVANPTHLLLFGNWELVDAEGQMISLSAFAPSVGLPSAQAAHLKSARVVSSRVICVENLTAFYELARWRQASGAIDFAAICLMGNPSPVCRHLLRSLARDVPLFVWADMDYGGFNILAQIRGQVNAQAQPLWMDVATFERYAMLAKPLAPRDPIYLTRLMQHPALADERVSIAHLLARGLKLEQEAIALADVWRSGS